MDDRLYPGLFEMALQIIPLRMTNHKEMPHRGGPLADGLTDESVVVCPLHGNTYDLATGAQVGGTYSVCTYPVTADADGSIVLDSRPR